MGLSSVERLFVVICDVGVSGASNSSEAIRVPELGGVPSVSHVKFKADLQQYSLDLGLTLAHLFPLRRLVQARREGRRLALDLHSGNPGASDTDVAARLLTGLLGGISSALDELTEHADLTDFLLTSLLRSELLRRTVPRVSVPNRTSALDETNRYRPTSLLSDRNELVDVIDLINGTSVLAVVSSDFNEPVELEDFFRRDAERPPIDAKLKIESVRRLLKAALSRSSRSCCSCSIDAATISASTASMHAATFAQLSTIIAFKVYAWQKSCTSDGNSSADLASPPTTSNLPHTTELLSTTEEPELEVELRRGLATSQSGATVFISRICSAISKSFLGADGNFWLAFRDVLIAQVCHERSST
mmetsp:Transcript_5294/g.15076  ORF Transcript_5294/g.15076 Transcript_5294/m.15076 type:complete len:361 (-) Transcript_5294:384-1466(-)